MRLTAYVCVGVCACPRVRGECFGSDTEHRTDCQQPRCQPLRAGFGGLVPGARLPKKRARMPQEPRTTTGPVWTLTRPVSPSFRPFWCPDSVTVTTSMGDSACPRLVTAQDVCKDRANYTGEFARLVPAQGGMKFACPVYLVYTLLGGEGGCDAGLIGVAISRPRNNLGVHVSGDKWPPTPSTMCCVKITIDTPFGEWYNGRDKSARARKLSPGGSTPTNPYEPHCHPLLSLVLVSIPRRGPP